MVMRSSLRCLIFLHSKMLAHSLLLPSLSTTEDRSRHRTELYVDLMRWMGLYNVNQTEISALSYVDNTDVDIFANIFKIQSDQ